MRIQSSIAVTPPVPSMIWRVQIFLLIVVMGMALALNSVSAQDAATPTPGVLTTPAATINCDPAATPTPAAPAMVFTISSADSEARYVAEEELADKGANTAVGKTNAVIGSILFDASGNPLACTRIDVDLRTLTSDSARRDNYLYSNTLETRTYPLATFILTLVEGWSGPLADGKATSFTLIGNLTVHGVTKLTSWQATVTLNGDRIEGTAETAFDMPDFNITPPKVGPVLSLNQHVRLQFDIVAQKAS